MIKFFRQIRQRLLSENRLGKYLLYAVGEIILVVIGILIALQINNANEARKARLQEITILENLRQDMSLDTLDINFNIQYHKKFITEEQKLLRFLQSNLEEPPYPIDMNNALGIPLIIEFHKSTFANLQNNDVGLLSNIKLRKDIARFYDFFQAAILRLENDYPTYQTYTVKMPYFLKYCRLDPGGPEMEMDNPDFEDYYNPDFTKQAIEMYDYEGAKSDEAFKLLLNESIFFRQVKLDYYIDMRNRIVELIQAIDAELNDLRAKS